MPGEKGMRGLMGPRGEFGVVGMPGPHGAPGVPGQPGGCWHCKQDASYQQQTTSKYQYSISPPSSTPPTLLPPSPIKQELSYNSIPTQIPLFKPIKEEENNKAFGQIQINKIGSSPSIPIQMLPPGYEKEEQIKFQKNGPIQLATFFGYGIGGNYGRNNENNKNVIKFGREEENNDDFIDVTNNEKQEEKEVEINNKAVLV
uniref:Col_cuticle_N domain-containing protein n=1 Tax=Meloidogyne hapla TaxID=6305 RepID=A0A1I8C2E4_MELHA